MEEIIEGRSPEWFKGIFQASGTVGQVVRLDRAALSEAEQPATAERTGKDAVDLFSAAVVRSGGRLAASGTCSHTRVVHSSSKCPFR